MKKKTGKHMKKTWKKRTGNDQNKKQNTKQNKNTWNSERNERTWIKQIMKHKKQQKTQLTRKQLEMWVAIDDFSEPYSKTWIA